jgi:hypothetical protein
MNYFREVRRSSMWWPISCTLALSSASRRSLSGPPSLLARRLCASSRRRCCFNSAIRSRISRRQPMCSRLDDTARGLLDPAHIYPLPQYVHRPGLTMRSLVRRTWPVRSGVMQLSGYIFRRITLPRTPLNKGPRRLTNQLLAHQARRHKSIPPAAMTANPTTAATSRTTLPTPPESFDPCWSKSKAPSRLFASASRLARGLSP